MSMELTNVMSACINELVLGVYCHINECFTVTKHFHVISLTLTTEIKSNMNTHTGEKHLMMEYQCEKCDFRSTKTKLQSHKIKIH